MPQKEFAMPLKPTCFDKIQALYKGELAKKFSYYLKKKTHYFAKIHQHKLPSTPSFFPVDLFSFIKPPVSLALKPTFSIFGTDYSLANIVFEPQAKLWSDIAVSDFSDIKVPWELSRLQFLLPYAVWIHNGQDSDGFYLKQINRILKDWCAANPYETGVGWSATLNVAIRFVTFYFLYLLVGPERLQINIVDQLFYHGLFIAREIDFSAKCSPNNHLYGEATALLLFGLSFHLPEEVRRAHSYLHQVKDLIRDDGSSEENSSGYQLFVTQMLAIQYACEPSLSLKQKLMASFFSLSWLSFNDSIAKFGDSDNGFFYSFYQDCPFSIKALSINDVEGATKPEGVFCNSNFYCVRNENSGVVIISGLEGGHGHSDGGSVLYFFGGRQILLDPGVSSYNLDPVIRRNERSSFFHNCPCKNKRDHTKQIATFRWAKKRCLTTIQIQQQSSFYLCKCEVGNIVHRDLLLSKDFASLKIVDDLLKSTRKDTLFCRFLFPEDFQSSFVAYVTDNAESGTTSFAPSYGKSQSCSYILLSNQKHSELQIDLGGPLSSNVSSAVEL